MDLAAKAFINFLKGYQGIKYIIWEKVYVDCHVFVVNEAVW